MPDATVAVEAAPADDTEQSTEVQASFSETEPSANAAASASPVGDRYSTTGSDPQPDSAGESTATDFTSQKPATSDLSVDDLAPAESAPTDGSADVAAAAEPSLPATDEPALETPAPDALLGVENATAGTESVEVQVDNAPSFTGDDISAALSAAAKAQPQLVGGRFADGNAVKRAKGAGYMVLADLAQKVLFVDTAAGGEVAPLAQEANELFRNTLADADTRADVAQIVPMWMASKNRKHGGVFFGGAVTAQQEAGSVVECQVKLDGGQAVTVLVPPSAAGQSLDAAQPVAIVGWIVDNPKAHVSGYTGSAQRAIFARSFMPLQ
jgi:hypothetical protein